jgi:fibulin 1/2
MNTCSKYSDCVNLPGTYNCSCKSGFIGNGSVCQVETTCDKIVCPETSRCIDKSYISECVCRPGYTLELNVYGNSSCIPVPSIQIGIALVAKYNPELDDSSSPAFIKLSEKVELKMDAVLSSKRIPGYYGVQVIKFTPGSTKVDMVIKFKKNSTVDAKISNFVQENVKDSISKGELSSLGVNTSYPISLQDLNECLQNNGGCHSKAKCTNRFGGFNCNCLPGYSGNGYNCVDIDECLANTHKCHERASCNNTDGNHRCKCDDGLAGNGTNCEDINECLIGSHLCHDNSTCNNTKGGYSCECNQGFSGNGTHCWDVNECLNAGHNCDKRANCSNEKGSFTCECFPGFTGNGSVCADVDECSTDSHSCSRFADCSNLQSTYNCTCKPGFIGNGFNCKVETTCTDIMCPANSRCVDKSFASECVCAVGYDLEKKTPLEKSACMPVPVVMIEMTLIAKFDSSLKDSSSPKFIALAEKLESALDGLLMSQNVSGYAGVQVAYFSPGSTKADIVIKFRNDATVDVKAASTVASKIQDAVTSGNLDSLGVNKSVLISSKDVVFVHIF